LDRPSEQPLSNSFDERQLSGSEIGKTKGCSAILRHNGIAIGKRDYMGAY